MQGRKIKRSLLLWYLIRQQRSAHASGCSMTPWPSQVMFSGPMPALSCRLNAWATALTCQWLMGPCKVNDVQIDGGKVRGDGVQALVMRLTLAWQVDPTRTTACIMPTFN